MINVRLRVIPELSNDRNSDAVAMTSRLRLQLAMIFAASV